MSNDKYYTEIVSEISAKLAKLEPDAQQEILKRVQRVLAVA